MPNSYAWLQDIFHVNRYFIILQDHYSFFIWSGKRTFRLLSPFDSPYLHYARKNSPLMHISCSSPFSSHPSSSLPLEKKVLCLPLCLIYFLLSQTLTLTLLFALCSNTPEIMDKSGLEEDEERGLPFPNNGGSEQRSETEIEIKAAFPPLPTLCSGRKQNLFSPLFFFPPFGRSLKVRQLLPIRVVFGRKKGRKQIERA